VLYDKTSVLPPKGSLREALFLTVWLRRQEQELQRVRLLAQGLQEIGERKESGVSGVYQDFLSALLPYTKKVQESKDKKMTEAMKHEVTKGVIVIKPPAFANPLVTRAKEMRMPDELRQKLAHRKNKP
jgi:hypothetical protein